MEFIYTYNIQTYIIFLVPIILSSILIILNRIFSKLIKLKSISTERSVTRGYETYEFGTHSIGSISTMSNNQFIILAILFLIFDVELIYIIPWITEVDVFFTWTNTVFVFLCHVILYSLVIELHEGVLIWYKQTLKII